MILVCSRGLVAGVAATELNFLVPKETMGFQMEEAESNSRAVLDLNYCSPCE